MAAIQNSDEIPKIRRNWVDFYENDPIKINFENMQHLVHDSR